MYTRRAEAAAFLRELEALGEHVKPMRKRPKSATKKPGRKPKKKGACTAGGGGDGEAACKKESSFGGDNTCAICMEDFDASDRIHPCACRHRFHAACVNDLHEKGVEKKHVCPICREHMPASVGTLVADAWTRRAQEKKAGE